MASKTSPFTIQKESFYNAKRVLLEGKRTRFEIAVIFITIVLHKFQPFCLALISACNTIVTHSTRLAMCLLGFQPV